VHEVAEDNGQLHTREEEDRVAKGIEGSQEEAPDLRDVGQKQSHAAASLDCRPEQLLETWEARCFQWISQIPKSVSAREAHRVLLPLELGNNRADRSYYSWREAMRRDRLFLAA